MNLEGKFKRCSGPNKGVPQNFFNHFFKRTSNSNIVSSIGSKSNRYKVLKILVSRSPHMECGVVLIKHPPIQIKTAECKRKP
jgi:hypothetical protein